eukprot:CAMPEP_0194584198 /NCGR_PEP_ID=MMETSP0292-20121207/16879_1 /TAXON_ID=39354 /ORGANISM="Heterosigma akashiwo, Strain CCMP2393" /LENGTH=35 /DNA_ID= /DNA_START= /DNA_END= /DNA_ORIENTATION=
MRFKHSRPDQAIPPGLAAAFLRGPLVAGAPSKHLG